MLPRRESRVHWVLPPLVHLRALHCSLTWSHLSFSLWALGFLLLFLGGPFCSFSFSFYFPFLPLSTTFLSSFLPASPASFGGQDRQLLFLGGAFSSEPPFNSSGVISKINEGWCERKNYPHVATNAYTTHKRNDWILGRNLAGSWNHVARVPGALAAPIYFPRVFTRAACARASFWAVTKKIP